MYPLNPPSVLAHESVMRHRLHRARVQRGLLL